MRLVRGILPMILGVSSVALACSSSDDANTSMSPGTDAGDAAPPPSPTTPDVEPPPPDAGTADVEPAPIGLASRQEVKCTEKPCYVAVSGVGSEHYCGLLDDGTVRCWGRDTRLRGETDPDTGAQVADGALGRGRVVTAVEGATPAPVVGLANVTQISVGANLGTCALTSDGSVYCWGRNEFGQLGKPTSEVRVPAPTKVEGLPSMSKVALGSTLGCAIAKTDGALWCWGTQNGRTGPNLLTPAPGVPFAPQVMSTFRAPVKDIAIGAVPGAPGSNPNQPIPFQDTITALLDDGVLATVGELPAGPVSFQELYSPVPVEVANVARIGTYGYLRSDGVAHRWVPTARALYVANAGTIVDVAIAAGRVRGTGTDVNKLIVYAEQGGMLLGDGKLYRWGRNTAGALGASPNVIDLLEEPMDVSHVAGDKVVSFAMTTASTCVSLVDGKVKCWGANQRGELGRGSVDFESHPEAEVIR